MVLDRDALAAMQDMPPSFNRCVQRVARYAISNQYCTRYNCVQRLQKRYE